MSQINFDKKYYNIQTIEQWLMHNNYFPVNISIKKDYINIKLRDKIIKTTKKEIGIEYKK
jgi:hypothetical protein